MTQTVKTGETTTVKSVEKTVKKMLTSINRDYCENLSIKEIRKSLSLPDRYWIDIYLNNDNMTSSFIRIFENTILNMYGIQVEKNQLVLRGFIYTRLLHR